MVSKVLRDPLFAFCVIGVVIYAGYTSLQTDQRPVVAMSDQQRAALLEDFEAVTGREPGEIEIATMEREFLIDELLFREAIESGLHLTSGEVRASLIEDMRYRITGVVDEPSAEALVNHYADNLERYQAEPTLTFRHVFFRDGVPPDVERRLQAGDIPDGDAFVHGREFPAYGRSMLRGLFGQPFLEQLQRQTLGEWSTALVSDYGTHYVLVSATSEATTLPFSVVRRQVEQDYRQARIDAAIALAVQSMEQDYAIQTAR